MHKFENVSKVGHLLLGASRGCSHLGGPAHGPSKSLLPDTGLIGAYGWGRGLPKFHVFLLGIPHRPNTERGMSGT